MLVSGTKDLMSIHFIPESKHRLPAWGPLPASLGDQQTQLPASIAHVFLFSMTLGAAFGPLSQRQQDLRMNPLP